MMKTLTRLVASVGCSVLILGLLLSLASSLGADVSPSDVLSALRSAIPAFVAAYVVCQIWQALSRAQRARVLLAPAVSGRDGDGWRVPAIFPMTLVTFVRGACADMLPARLGELSYVAMLNRGCAVPASACLSSLSIGLLFDFLALLAVLAVSIPAAAHGLTLLGSALTLLAICIVGVAMLFYALPAVAAWRWERCSFFRWRPMAACVKLLRDMADAVVAVRRGRVAGRVLLLSISVRAAKYIGLYFLFVAVTRPFWPDLSRAPVASVLVALIAAEGAASLPVPTFLSFGSYEAGGLAALTALGFPAGDSLTAMVAMHLLSQIIDYSFGGIAFLIFSWISKPASPANGANPPNGVNSANGVNDVNGVNSSPHSATAARRSSILHLLLALFFLGASLLFAAWQVRAIKKRGRLTAPPKGEAVQPTAAETAARDTMMRTFGGKVVWSSNRSGSHDIWILDGPDAQPRRLTRSGFTDTYPRFSPDGTMVAFSRSTEPWVSQRNFEKWDTWVLDLATGEERLVATNAYQACWDPTALILYAVRAGGRQLVAVSADPAEPRESVVLESGVPPLDDGVIVTLPDVHAGDPFLAVTLRGAKRATVHVRLADGIKVLEPQLQDIAAGCQMVWRGNGIWSFAWIDHPGRQKNAIFARNLTEGPVVLLDAEEPWSHEYFPRFAGEGRWLVYGASTGGHEQDSEDYEIFLWDTADTNTPPARLTFHTGNDCWPDIAGARCAQ